jgi:hypothetical protein
MTNEIIKSKVLEIVASYPIKKNYLKYAKIIREKFGEMLSFSLKIWYYLRE